MGTSKDILNNRIEELEIMLNHIEENHKQIYDEAEAHYMNLCEED